MKRAIDFTHSRLFKQLHDDVFGAAAPCPFGLLLCNWDFDATPASVELLQQLAYIAEAIHAPLIIGLSPAFGYFGTLSNIAFEQYGWFTHTQQLFAISRTAHYVRALICDWSGPFNSIEECEHTLNAWVAQYVSILPEPVNRPLLQADIRVVASGVSPDVLLMLVYANQSYLLNPQPVPARVIATLPPGKIQH